MYERIRNSAPGSAEYLAPRGQHATRTVYDSDGSVYDGKTMQILHTVLDLHT